MPQIGPMEILVVGVLALMVFGPEKLPDMARSVGRFVNQVKTMASEAKSEFDISIDEKEKAKVKTGGEGRVSSVNAEVQPEDGIPNMPESATPPAAESKIGQRSSSTEDVLVSSS